MFVYYVARGGMQDNTTVDVRVRELVGAQLDKWWMRNKPVGIWDHTGGYAHTIHELHTLGNLPFPRGYSTTTWHIRVAIQATSRPRGEITSCNLVLNAVIVSRLDTRDDEIFAGSELVPRMSLNAPR